MKAEIFLEAVESRVRDGILVKFVAVKINLLAFTITLGTYRKYKQNKAGMIRVSNLRTKAISAGSVFTTAPL